MMLFKTWLRRFLIAIAILLVLVIGLLGFLTLTHAGLNSILWSAQKFLPSLTVGEAQGALLTGFNLKKVEYIDDSMQTNITLDEVGFDLGKNCLSTRAICLDYLKLKGLNAKILKLPPPTKEVEEEVESSSSGPIVLPIPVSIASIMLDDIDVNFLGNKVKWDTFHTGIEFYGSQLTLKTTDWDQINVSLPPQVEDKTSSTAKTSKASTSLAKAASKTPQKPLSQQPDIELPDIKLPFDIVIEPFNINHFKLEGATPIEVSHFGFKAQVIDGKAKIEKLQLVSSEGDVDLDAGVTLSGDYPLSLSLSADVKNKLAAGQKLVFNASGSVADLQANLELAGPIEANLVAKAQLLKASLPFDISLSKVKANWPILGDSQYQLGVDKLALKGSLEGYTINLKAAAKGEAIPDVDLALEAAGDLKHINLSDLKLNTLGGEISGEALANWEPSIDWETKLNVKNIQPNKKWEAVQGNINASLENSGKLTAQGGWDIKLPLLKIDGQLGGYPIALDAKLDANDADANGLFFADIPQFKFTHGVNQISLKGTLDKEWDMNLALNMPDLSKSLAGLSGNVSGTIALSGAQKTPKVISDITGGQIKWQDQASLDALTLKGDLTPLPVPTGDIKLALKNIRSQDQLINSVNLTANGTDKKHQAIFDVNSERLKTHLKLTGSLTQTPDIKWQGELSEGTITVGPSRWAMNHSAKLGYDGKTQTSFVQAHCWQQSPSQICIDKDIKAGASGSANVSIKQFDFNKIKPLVPEATQLSGELNATAFAQWAPDQAPKVEFNLDLPKGYVRQKTAKAPIQIGWDKISLAANMANNKLDLTWLADLTQNGKLVGNATIPDVRKENMTIQGKNVIEPINFDFLQPILGKENHIGANLQSNIAFSGPIKQPKVNGNLDLVNIELQGKAYPVDIHNSYLKTSFNGYSAVLKSDLVTPEGTLGMTGNADWQNIANWSANLKLFTDNLQIEVPSLAKLKLNTDLNVSLSPQVAKLTGEINLPYARIKVQDLPESAVGVSSDEVMLDKELKPVEKEPPLPMAMEMDVAVNIGDDVNVSAFGLDTNLAGHLKITQENKGPFVLGDINMINGSYKSFGQDLLIKEGKITMNGPVDQPYLSIKAIRNPDSTEDGVTAGLQITGPASAPQAVVFSEPAMAQTSALSYLLRGHDLDDSSGNSMTTALLGLTLAKGNGAVGSMGDKIGVEDLQLGTSGSGDDSQVTVSGYIAPGLQVKYGMGIFDALGEFTVRYEVFKNFYLQAVTGVDTAVDAIYQFEFH